jgi:transcriptional regulatory protein LevR
MNVDLNIKSHKLKYLTNCVHLTYLLKSMKNNRNIKTNETDWINIHSKKEYYAVLNI